MTPMISAAFSTALGLVALTPQNEGPDRAVIAGLSALPAGRRVLLTVTERGRGLFGSVLGRLPVNEAHAALADSLGAVPVHAEGSLTEAVEAVGKEFEADVVVLGRPARGWGEHGLRVLRLSDAPVLVMPEGLSLRLGRAVLGMDLSPNALRAFDLLHGVVDIDPVAVADPVNEGTARETLLAHIAAAWGDREPPVRMVESAKPADALLRAAEGADLLVVGSRGLTPLAAVLLGSTAEKLGARCPVPLLVFREPGTRTGLLRSFVG